VSAPGSQPIQNHYRKTRLSIRGVLTWLDYGKRRRPLVDRKKAERNAA
jgi:hypothetical protein